MKAIIAATLIGVVLMFTGILVKEKKSAVTIATVLLFLLLGVNVWELVSADVNAPQMYFNNMLRIDSYALWFNTMMTGCTFLYALLVGKEVAKVGTHVADYFALISFILCGIYLLSGYNNMLILFIGIEILSIPQYILAGSDKKNLKSSEASLKYFLMGAFSTGILLMGITLLYGATGSFDIIGFTFLQSAELNPLALAGILFLMVALSFKVSAAPFHIWTPDVYDGTPTPFTAFMATVVKAGAFIAFLRLFSVAFGSLSSHWMMILAIITALTLLIGNITAVFQQSVKRMLAYSSIAQAGFMLFAIIAVNATAWQGMIIYAVAYSVATIGVFAVLMKLKDYTYDGFNGLARKEPALAFFTTIFLLSLAGIPLTGGFMAKFFVLQAAVEQGSLLWLVIFGLLMAAVSAYYYFRVIIAMYFKEGTPELHAEVSGGEKFLLAMTCVLVILIGVAPQLFLNNI
ncbi:MAG: NADH-quinone oxidoreductase subunit N [Sphingobacteriales bacterium]|nr:MAG: NADH-quinone oxidoreductase subunit N [Sphingobacteriales bacterium]